MLATIVISIFIDCRNFYCNPKPVPVNVSPSYSFQAIVGPMFSLALSAHVTLAQTCTMSTQTQCPGMAPIILHLALKYLNQSWKDQLELPENPCHSATWVCTLCTQALNK